MCCIHPERVRYSACSEKDLPIGESSELQSFLEPLSAFGQRNCKLGNNWSLSFFCSVFWIKLVRCQSNSLCLRFALSGFLDALGCLEANLFRFKASKFRFAGKENGSGASSNLFARSLRPFSNVATPLCFLVASAPTPLVFCDPTRLGRSRLFAFPLRAVRAYKTHIESSDN